jgi:hypothetical protein
MDGRERRRERQSEEAEKGKERIMEVKEREGLTLNSCHQNKRKGTVQYSFHE